MRAVNLIVVQSTETDPSANTSEVSNAKAEGQKQPLWHYLIARNGNVVRLLSDKNEAENTIPHSSVAIHVAYVGGIGKDGTKESTINASQELALYELLIKLSDRHPKAEIIGLSDLTSAKGANPGFAVREWMYNYDYLSAVCSSEE